MPGLSVPGDVRLGFPICPPWVITRPFGGGGHSRRSQGRNPLTDAPSPCTHPQIRKCGQPLRLASRPPSFMLEEGAPGIRVPLVPQGCQAWGTRFSPVKTGLFPMFPAFPTTIAGRTTIRQVFPNFGKTLMKLGCSLSPAQVMMPQVAEDQRSP